MKSKIHLLFCLLLIILAPDLSAQNEDQSVKRSKLKNNFENIRTSPEGVYYEQRLYRNPFTGLIEMKAAMADSSVNTFIPMVQGIPIGKFTFGNRIEFSKLTAKERKQQNSTYRFPLLRNYKLDFWIQPYFSAIFGNFDKPIQSNTSIAIQSQLFLLPGMSFNFGILFPITNDLDARPKKIRPAPVYLNQFFAAGNNFISATAGFFQNDQYGVNVQYRYADFKSAWSYGLEAGLTGEYYYPKTGIYYGGLDKFILIGDIAYRLANPDIIFKVSGGRYLAGDAGARLDVMRQFTNVEIGFYATKTSNGSTLGFNFAIPIPPGKILQGKNARLRTTDEFRWEYSYTRGYSIGERYRAGYQLDQRLRQFHTNYLNRQYQQLK